MRKRITDREEGQALVEFALLSPILFLILFGIVQFGIAFMHSIALTDAVRTGARQATVSRRLSDPVGAARGAVLNAATDLDSADVNVTVTSSWQPGSDVTVSATYPYAINILGIVVASGDLHSATTERVEY